MIGLEQSSLFKFFITFRHGSWDFPQYAEWLQREHMNTITRKVGMTPFDNSEQNDKK